MLDDMVLQLKDYTETNQDRNHSEMIVGTLTTYDVLDMVSDAATKMMDANLSEFFKEFYQKFKETKKFFKETMKLNELYLGFK